MLNRPRYHFGDHAADYLALGLLAVFILLLGLLWTTPATGASLHDGLQQTDHRDIVQAAKRQVVNELHIDPDDPNARDECGRFEITWRVALMLSGEGAGLIRKVGNNCRGFSPDAIMYVDGTVVDVLGRGNEGPTTPMWLIQPQKRPITDWAVAPPLPTTAPPPASVPPEPESAAIAALGVRLDAIFEQLDELRQQSEVLRQQGDVNGAKIEHVEHRLNEIVAGAKQTGLKLLPWLAAGVAGGACVAKE